MHRAIVPSDSGRSANPGVCRRAKFYHQQLDALRTVRQEVRPELLVEGYKHRPGNGSARSLRSVRSEHPYCLAFCRRRTVSAVRAVLASRHIAALITGQLERAKKQISSRGLNQNCNHDLKNLFKGPAIVASSKPGPIQEFYA